MLKNNRLAQILIILSISLLFVQCKQKDKSSSQQIDPAFTGYISAYTSGVISNEETIIVRLTEEQNDVEPNQKVEEQLFNFSPSIKGESYWIDKRTIAFNPESSLPSDKSFEAKFHLYKIAQVTDNLKTLKFQFKTKKQVINIESEGLQAYNNSDLTKQKLNGKLYTSDNANNEAIEKTFSATQNGKELNITWEHLGDGRKHNYTVENIVRGKKKCNVILQWNGEAIGSNDSGDEIIEIPPLGEFNVFDLSIVQQPQQCITIYFSDPLNQTQELDGLIHLKSGANVKLVINQSQIKVYPETRLTESTEIIVEQGVRNIMDYQLKERYVKEVKFSSIKPNVELVGDGVILPNSNGLIFPFRAVNLSGVNVKIIKIFENNIAQFLQTNQFDGQYQLKRVGRIVYKNPVPLLSDKNVDLGEWNMFSLDLSELIEAEPGAIYRIQISFDKSQSLYPCANDSNSDDNFTGYDEDPELAKYDQPNSDYYYYDDYDDSYSYNNNFNWNEKDNPCHDSYYMRNQRSIVRNVLASDLGIIVKSSTSNELKVAVSDLKTTDPLSGVSIEIYNYQNQLMAEGITDGQGFATISVDRKPFLLLANKDKQKGYLRLDDGSALSLSMFDIGGQHSKKGIKGYIYGERGVWRPGDSIFVSFIIEDKNKSLPENHPVVFELYTPENQLYQRKVKTTSTNGFYDFRTATKQDDPTGNWLAKIKVGGSTFSKEIKIETVKPNRLKIVLDFDGKKILKSGDNFGTLEVKWLHGAKAKNLKADIEVKILQGSTKFNDYPAYTFDDPAKKFYSKEKMIFDSNLDDQGKASVSTDFSIGDNAPGMLTAKFKTRAFENGGDFSTDISTFKYSPYSGYVGLKVPEGPGWNGALYSNEPNLIPIVTVDEDGNQVDRNKVKIEIFEVYWRWWWEHSSYDDLAQYVSNRSENLIQTDYVNTKDGKAIYEMNLKRESWGRKLIIVTDPVTGHSSGKLFYTTYKGWWSRPGADNPGGAEMLTFSTDKKKYNVGEEVKVELPATQKGKALVSLETGSKILETFWVDVNPENNSFAFKTNETMSPNIFIHISFIQPHNQKNNDLPIRLYGVQPISVENPATHLNPVIEMPDVLEPESEVTLKVKEANGKKMTYTIAVVDDGLLDLTKFKTPNAWSSFYAREALGVKTWDMYKYVMGAFSGEMAGLLALGGDEELTDKGGKKANRFKPVVTFLGPFELKSGSNTHTFTMPNYVGSVRTMIVAGQDGAYGSTEKTTPVKKPLMTIATLPRVLGPTEKVKLPVTVFAMDDNIKEVKVKIETNELFKIIGESSKKILFTEQGDQNIDFDIEVSENIGIATVKVIATSGKEKAEFDIELDVRLPNPRVTKLIDGIIEPGKDWNAEYAAVGIQGTNNGIIEISSIPPLNLENRLKYLIRYPHGCIEQTTSSVFPQLHLAKLLDLSNEQKEKIESNITAGIDQLKKFQLNNGGLSYWPGESGHASDWGTNYAGHFMLEAKAEGYSLPPGFLKNWINFQSKQANDWSVNSSGTQHHYYNSNQLIQSYRLYTLALAGKPAMGAMNRMREMGDLTIAAKWRLAAAYHLAGREKIAKKMVQDVKTKISPYRELSYSYGSNVRDEAMILEALVLLDQKDKAKDVMEEIAENLASRNWYSTQTTAYGLLAIAKFVGITGVDQEIKYELSLNNSKSVTKKTTSPVIQTALNIDEQLNGKVKITNNCNKMLFVKVQLDGIPLAGNETDSESDLKLSVNYKDLSGKTIDISRLAQGSDFVAEVTIHHPGIRKDYKEMALTQIFPSGWEIRNMRMEGSSVASGDIPRYQDIRDDRVYSYFDMQKNTSKTYRILLNAAYVGSFYLPAVYCEAMYDNEINAQKAGQWVEIYKQE
ncbi:MAG: alpha-2-macroglobulin [Salinivirgaceae bacterium]|nr:alpha-2-macroglobulin [Salinivirgaceae bacterium]